MLASAVGSIGFVNEVPAQTVRIETSAATTATTSFVIIEHARTPAPATLARVPAPAIDRPTALIPRPR